MGEPLDVSLRVRMRYEAGDAASKAIGDVEKVRATAERMGAGAGTDRLGQSLRGVSGQAQATDRELGKVATTAARLGGGEAATKLATGLKDAAQAGGGATREMTNLGQAAARFGAVSTVAYLSRDLKAVHAPAQGAKRDLDAVREAADRIGRGTGLRDLEGDLQRAVRKADDLERRLGAVARHGGGRGRGDHAEFANEAIRASGLGVGGLRFGMSGAAAGGLAAGAGVGAVGGAIAMATGQAISFEHAMTEVKKAVNDTPEGIRALQRDILGFSQISGIAKTEIAGLVAQAGYLNVPRDQLRGFAEISTKAAVGFQMRGEEAGTALGHLRNGYNIKDNASLRLAGDAINTVGDHVGTRERDILTYLNDTNGISQMHKVPLAKNAALGGSIMSMGVAPNVASTGVKEVFDKLATANTNKDHDFHRGLRSIGMSGQQVKGMMNQDALGGVLTVLEKIRGLRDDKKANAIHDLFGEGNMQAVSRMAESLDKVRGALDLVSDPSRYAGSLERTFKIFSSDTQAQIKRAEAAMESWAAKIGSKFSPVVKEAAAAVERWFNAMNKAMDRREQAEDIASRMAKGAVPTPEEQAKIDADPRLKKSVDEQLLYRRHADEIEAGRQRLIAPPAEGAKPPPTMEEARDAFRRKAEQFELRRRGETGAKPEALPGTGKRSDLQDGVKASLASYHEEVDRSLTRTERLAREMGRRIAEDLTVRPKVEDAAFRTGGPGGARLQTASLGGGGLGGGLGGGSIGMPGRFGGAIPRGGGGGSARSGGGGIRQPRGGAARFGEGRAGSGVAPGGGGHRAPSTAEGRENTASWLAFAQRPAAEGGLGLSKEQAHGLVAGLQGESGANLDPSAWNGNDRGKPAGGTAQWRDDRLRNLQAFAKEQGKDWRDRGVQQSFLRHEMVGSGAHGGGSERRAYEAIKGASTRQEALGAHVSKYERPQFPAAEVQKRSQYLYGHEGGAAEASSGGKPEGGQAGSNGAFDPLGGAARRYSSGFGMREHPVHGGRRMHYGQDMAAPAGTPVTAMQGGRVTGIGRMGDVTITHPDGSTKTYRHIDPSGIKVGQEVEGGAQIGGLRARDPRSTGPHLHLEATDAQGRRYDPRAEIDEAGQPGRTMADGRRRPEVLADPNDERRRTDEGPRQVRSWAPQVRHPAEDGPVDRQTARQRAERASIDDTLDEYEKTPEGQADKKRDAEMFNRRGRMYREDETQSRPDDGRSDHGYHHIPDNIEMKKKYLENRYDREAADGKSYEEYLEAGVQARRPVRSEFTPDRELGLDEIRKFRAPEPEPRSPRFMDPASYQLKPGVAADTAGGGGAGRGATFSGPPAIQNFYGGFDAHEVGRRAQLEQNREVRRTMAGALHDVGSPRAA